MTDKFKISLWFNGCYAPSVLMIDDLSDAYIGKYEEAYKNDWGYLTNGEGSCYSYLSKHLLSKFPEIKISFFVPYLKHNVIADECHVIKNDIFSRNEFKDFISKLKLDGHEIAYHGSNHGIYKNGKWIQEWELFNSYNEAFKSVNIGVKKFSSKLNIEISGGKYCGYKYNDFSDYSIVNNGLKYWCKDAKLDLKSDMFINSNHLLEFPTNLAGNVFVRYLYKKEILWKDVISKLLSPLQYYKNCQMEKKIKHAIIQGKIISIQEHYSPSTTRGVVQSCNVISDIKSLSRIYSILKDYDIWYATCCEISDYYLLKESSDIHVSNNRINIHVKQTDVINKLLTIESLNKYEVSDKNDVVYNSENKRNKYYLTLPVNTGENFFWFK